MLPTPYSPDVAHTPEQLSALELVTGYPAVGGDGDVHQDTGLVLVQPNHHLLGSGTVVVAAAPRIRGQHDACLRGVPTPAAITGRGTPVLVFDDAGKVGPALLWLTGRADLPAIGWEPATLAAWLHAGDSPEDFEEARSRVDLDLTRVRRRPLEKGWETPGVPTGDLAGYTAHATWTPESGDTDTLTLDLHAPDGPGVRVRHTLTGSRWKRCTSCQRLTTDGDTCGPAVTVKSVLAGNGHHHTPLGSPELGLGRKDAVQFTTLYRHCLAHLATDGSHRPSAPGRGGGSWNTGDLATVLAMAGSGSDTSHLRVGDDGVLRTTR